MRSVAAIKVAILVVLALDFEGQAQAAPTIHVVIAADTLDPIVGKSVETDEGNVSGVFSRNIPKSMLRAQRLDQQQCRPDAILAAIGALPAGPDDTVLVYYSGHGGFDARIGQYLRFPRLNTYLPRERINQAIRAKRARLGVLLTDCCNNVVAVPGEPSVGAPAPQPPKLSPLFFSLLVAHSGHVDLTSSRQGEQSIGYPGIRMPGGQTIFPSGGIFTEAMVDLFKQRSEEVLTWAEVDKELTRHVAMNFKQLRPDGLENADDPEHPQMTQTVVARLAVNRLTRPMPPDDSEGGNDNGNGGEDTPRPNRLAFGAVADANGGDGLRVLKVFPDSPAAKNGLEPGDIILTINDAPVRTTQDWVAAVSGSPNLMRFTIRNVRTGGVEARSVQLDRGGPGTDPAPGRRLAFGAVVVENGGNGLRITQTQPGSPAAQLGLEEGDVILSINETAMRTTEDYRRAVQGSPDQMRFTFRDVRTGVVKQSAVKLDRGHEAPAPPETPPVPGAVPTSLIRPAFGARMAENGGNGVAVVRSEPGSPAAGLGLERGDVILTINGVPIRSVAEHNRAIQTSPDVMQFTFRDIRTGVVKAATLRLDR